MGSPRDGDDRIDWLIQYKRFQQALQVLKADKSLRSSSHAKAGCLTPSNYDCRR